MVLMMSISVISCANVQMVMDERWISCNEIEVVKIDNPDVLSSSDIRAIYSNNLVIESKCK